MKALAFLGGQGFEKSEDFDNCLAIFIPVEEKNSEYAGLKAQRILSRSPHAAPPRKILKKYKKNDFGKKVGEKPAQKWSQNGANMGRAGRGGLEKLEFF
jgi:hypothetical protein